MRCSICERDVPSVNQEKHHLIPRCKKGSLDKDNTILVCIDCADMLHLLFTNRELKQELNTLERIKNNEKIKKWIKWVRKKKDFGACMKKKKKR